MSCFSPRGVNTFSTPSALSRGSIKQPQPRGDVNTAVHSQGKGKGKERGWGRLILWPWGPSPTKGRWQFTTIAEWRKITHVLSTFLINSYFSDFVQGEHLGASVAHAKVIHYNTINKKKFVCATIGLESSNRHFKRDYRRFKQHLKIKGHWAKLRIFVCFFSFFFIFSFTCLYIYMKNSNLFQLLS